MSKRSRCLSADEIAGILNDSYSSDSEISESEIDYNLNIDSNYFDALADESYNERGESRKPAPRPSGQCSWIWSYNINPITPKSFCESPGVKVNPSFSSELDFFRVFFDDEIVKIITTETNAYQHLQSDPSTSSKVFKPVTKEEIFVFLALTVLMGIVKKPTITMYFSTDPILATPFFNQTMERDRYVEILRYLYISSNIDNKLDVIYPVIEKIRENFKSAYIPEKNVYIDESLFLWEKDVRKPPKRSRCGLKLYKLCDSASGYIWNFILCAGKDAQAKESAGNYVERIIKTLLEDRIEKGYNLYVDRFFTSPTLAEQLTSLGVNLCGTVDKNRENMPRNFPPEPLKSGNTACLQKGNINIIAYKDQRDVVMLTTIHDNNMIDTGKINKKTGVPIFKPEAVLDYDRYMAGVVDLNDFAITDCPAIRRTKKWYQKLFFNILDLCIINANVLYNIKHVTTMPPMIFRINLVKQIVAEFATEKSPNASCLPKIPNPLRLSGRHFPSLCKKTPGKKHKAQRRRCVVCSKNSKRKTTYIECKECDVGLCPEDCFQIYHTQKDF